MAEAPFGNREAGMQDDTAGLQTVVFERIADIRTITAMHAALVEALSKGRPVEIDCSDVQDADLTLVQLLLAAFRSARRAGASLTMRQPLPEVLRDLLARSGFIDDGGSAPESAAFWMVGGT
jgi:anti-anti-sigma regulatory factor